MQTGVQRWQATPLILAAEGYEEQKPQAPIATAPVVVSITAATPAPSPAPTNLPERAAAGHAHAPGTAAHDHAKTAVQPPAQAVNRTLDPDLSNSTAKVWEPANGAERIAWTWVANALHAFSMALLVFAVMGVWRYRRGTALTALPLSGFVVAAGWLSFHLWPTLGLPAVLPGVEASPLQARQLWSVLAVGSAATACALAAFGTAKWRWPAVAILLALRFVVGAPQLQGDALAGYNPQVRASMEQLLQQFFWATTWVALSFWLSLGLVCGLVFQRWLQPVLMENFKGAGLEAA